MSGSYSLMGSQTDIVTAPAVDVVANTGGSSGWFSNIKIDPMMGPMMSTFGAINSAIGTYYQSQAMSNNLKFQADMSKINAGVAESNAQATLLAGQRAQQNVRLRTAKLKAQQKVSMAANGVDLGSRSATNILTTTDTMGEIDALTVESNAIRAAFGYRTQSVNDMNTSRMSSAAADGISPYGSAASSLLGNAGSVASSWYRNSKGS